MYSQKDFGKALADRRSAKSARFGRLGSPKLSPGSAAVRLPVYREFVDMPYSMSLPIFGLGAVFVGVCVLAAFKLNEPIYFALAALGAMTTFLRVASIRSYARVSQGHLFAVHFEAINDRSFRWNS